MQPKATSKWTVSASLLVIMMLLGMYVGAYVALTEDIVRISGRRHRDFSSSYLATAFRPCAWVESAVTGEEVGTCCMSDFWDKLVNPKR
jgi:hypothetical protein